MTRNRTAFDTISALGTHVIALLLVVLAMGVTLTHQLSAARDRMRHVEMRMWRRAVRRPAA